MISGKVSAAKWGRQGLGLAVNGLVRNIFNSFLKIQLAIFEKYYKRISIMEGVGEMEWDWEKIVATAKWSRQGYAADGCTSAQLIMRSVFGR